MVCCGYPSWRLDNAAASHNVGRAVAVAVAVVVAVAVDAVFMTVGVTVAGHNVMCNCGVFITVAGGAVRQDAIQNALVAGMIIIIIFIFVVDGFLFIFTVAVVAHNDITFIIIIIVVVVVVVVVAVTVVQNGTVLAKCDVRVRAVGGCNVHGVVVVIVASAAAAAAAVANQLEFGIRHDHGQGRFFGCY